MNRDLLNRTALALGVVVVVAGGFALARAIRSASSEAPLAARAGQTIVTLEVEGTACAGCADAVRAALAAVPGVVTVTLRPAQKRAFVVCAPGVPDSALTGAAGRAAPGVTARVAAR